MTTKEFQENNGIIGKSKEIRDLADITMQVALSDISVLIQGESGSGKEVFARAIHNHSHRAGKKMVSVNCGAIPEGLLESELFGHEKGSFTGATDSRKGYFEIADGGTLFLDEIAEMPLTTQVKLLRALETGEFMRIGSEKVTKVDVRIVAAANKDLQLEVDARRFRRDLYFRLKAVTLYLPPLRERREDISPLAQHFLAEYGKRNRIQPPVLLPRALDLLTAYHWPGNVRELKNTIESAAALNKNGPLDESAFTLLLSDLPGENEQRNLPVHLKRSSESLDREMIYRALIEIKKDLMELKQIAYNTPHVEAEDHLEIEEIIPLVTLEKDAIEKALDFTRGNKRKAAQLLKISERTLYRKLKEYDL